ncbi:hypothetical protein Ciccas_004247 [Cichlidogyrus casuarinus]|uniref:SSD domain-containing protein n=1 Tax=Cichlidogyrus casuarinus TaxID=1844966 RepID=A0ABD2QC27_9PLAT
MVKSKWGLTLSACLTVIASLLMSISFCITIGIMVPIFTGSEIFPYLVILIGFENVIILTKSVVATPVHLDVKFRVAQGLSREGWPIVTNLFCAYLLVFLGFFTFNPAIVEFCWFALIGLTTDFFLQMFFFHSLILFQPVHLAHLIPLDEVIEARTESQRALHKQQEDDILLIANRDQFRDGFLDNFASSSLRLVMTWSSRLWLTFTMLMTSLLAAALILTFTCLGMILLQSLQARFSCDRNCEKAIRINPTVLRVREQFYDAVRQSSDKSSPPTPLLSEAKTDMAKWISCLLPTTP